MARARENAGSDQGSRAPRVIWRASNRGAGRGVAEAMNRSRRLLKAPRVAVQYREKMEKVHPLSNGRDCTALDVEARGISNAIEQSRFGGGHPNLTAPLQPLEQRCAAVRIQVRRDLVQQQDRRCAAAVGDQLGMREDEAKQQRLLLAGGAARGGHVFRRVSDREVLPVGANRGATGGSVAAAGRAKLGGEVVAAPAFDCDFSAGEGGFRCIGEPLGKGGDRIFARR